MRFWNAVSHNGNHDTVLDLKDNLPQHVTIVEVGPRDGLQDETAILESKSKIDFINKLSQTGLKRIEVTSFVHPKLIPQLADAEKVFNSIERNPKVEYSVLIPNETGLNRALNNPPSRLALLTATTETFTKKNINCSVYESLQNCKHLAKLAKQHSLPVRCYISCCWGCPYEGKVDRSRVLHIARQLQAYDCDEIVLADTIGVATPLVVQELIHEISNSVPAEKIALHLHDSRGQALANVLAALQSGIHIFDSSVAGLGGCPYAPGASGNLATEDLLYLLHGMNIETGVDLQAIIEVAHFISKQVSHNNSRTASAGIFNHEQAIDTH